MNLYSVTNNKQRNDLLEADVFIENREYTLEEMRNIKNEVATYIFSKSKNEISREASKYIEFLNKIENI